MFFQTSWCTEMQVLCYTDRSPRSYLYLLPASAGGIFAGFSYNARPFISWVATAQVCTALPLQLPLEQQKLGLPSPQAAAAVKDDCIAWGSLAPLGWFFRSTSYSSYCCDMQSSGKTWMLQKIVYGQLLFSRVKRIPYNNTTKYCRINKNLSSSVHLFVSTAGERRYSL